GTLGGALALAAASGAWIWHNTHQLNRYTSAQDRQRMQADYEKRYKALEYAPQPHVTEVDLNADLYPGELRARLRGTYTLVNRSEQPIADFYVLLPPQVQVEAINADLPLTLADQAPELGWRHYRLAQPLAAGATTRFRFDIGYAVHGFTNDGASDVVLGNGTFVNGAEGREVARLPAFGYDASYELSSDRERKKFGLAPKERMRDLDDARGRNIGVDWIDHYQATLSTDAGQTAITSGVLTRQWNEGGRSYFSYRMDGRSLALLTVLSGRYAVKRDRWQGAAQSADIEINYHAGHEFDLDRMIAGVKDSLDYYTQHFSPYQYPLVRIVEFPRYERFAESFPNTIPYSEAIGFIARVDDSDPKDIDYPYFVTAHEMAHQWWAHQEMPADVQGAEFITESLAEYSALLVLKHKYGDARMHRFLHYELDRYLFGRAGESKKEQPLMRADGPSYLHYAKGSLALYALQDAIGEDAVNRALSAFVQAWRFRGPPYPISRDLLAELRKVTPPEQQYLIEDLFETITLYELRATSAHARK
ncbi:MAG TPA: M1 family aminopeptidase, partial [Nevskiaceae bacterium]|nr:M1 family aminopeptidase [Nevskiaceae bacterium]